jgi:hypothetical protein
MKEDESTKDVNEEKNRGERWDEKKYFLCEIFTCVKVKVKVKVEVVPMLN